MTKRPEFQGAKLAASKNDLIERGLKIADLGASTRLHESDRAVRAKQLDEGKRYIDLAQRLSVPYIRVFGDRIGQGEAKKSTIDRVVAGLQELGAHAKESGVTVLLESHGDFCDSPTLLQILKGAEMPSVGLLWDAHHTVVYGKENPAETGRQLGAFVRHVHLKDSKPADKDVRYVLTGQGTIPLREIVKALVIHGYRGYFSFEWEKVWHPEIEEPEIAFPHYATVMSGYLRDAGVDPA